TSRIAAKADPGTFWCSEEFADSLSDKSIANLQSKGKHSLKNISEHKELYELKNENNRPVFIDSVCRMVILNTDKAIKHPTNKDVFFCSTACLDIHMKNQGTDTEAS
ncbi:MAG: hypothetical protein ABUL44_00725, partial [Flavobacterium sp.]